jgi:hypothetical protein
MPLLVHWHGIYSICRIRKRKDRLIEEIQGSMPKTVANFFRALANAIGLREKAVAAQKLVQRAKYNFEGQVVAVR